MSEYTAAGKGLKLMFQGTIVKIVGAVVSAIPLVGTLVGTLVSLVGAAMMLYGLYVAMPAHENYKVALGLEIISMVLKGLNEVFQHGLLGGVFSMAEYAVSFFVVYYICSTTGALLTTKGDQQGAKLADLIIKLYLICSLVSIACTLVSWIPLVGILADMGSAAAGVVQSIAFILLLCFCNKASKSLLA